MPFLDDGPDIDLMITIYYPDFICHSSHVFLLNNDWFSFKSILRRYIESMNTGKSFSLTNL